MLSKQLEVVSVGGSSWVIVQSKYVRLPGAATSAGSIKPARVIFNNEREYGVEVLMKVIQTEGITSSVMSSVQV